jgi:hypothetical protein
MPHRFILISRWRLEASPAAVWQLLADVDCWPAWWPDVRCVARGAASPLGDVAELRWPSALPYAVRLRIKTIAVERPQRLDSQTLDGLQGMGTWLVDPAERGCVDLTYRWEVWLDRPWMRALSVLLRPAYAWNHFRVMGAAAGGMARQLGCRVEHLSQWTGSRWP